MATEANLRPDPEAGTLTVEIHSLSTPRDNVALENLCAELTETQTIYPGTNGTDLSKIEILVILIINVLRLSDAAKSCLSP